jgi:hypothetical protein
MGFNNESNLTIAPTISPDRYVRGNPSENLLAGIMLSFIITPCLCILLCKMFRQPIRDFIFYNECVKKKQIVSPATHTENL